MRYESADAPRDADDESGRESGSGDDDENESGSAADDFPHVYGPLNADAVVAVVPVPRDDGGFSMPEGLRAFADE